MEYDIEAVNFWPEQLLRQRFAEVFHHQDPHVAEAACVALKHYQDMTPLPEQTELDSMRSTVKEVILWQPDLMPS